MAISMMSNVYVCVKDLDIAIKFWESFFKKKIRARYKTRWADFDDGKTVTLGIYRPAFDNLNYKKVDNVIIGFYTDDIKKERARVKKLKPKSISKIEYVNFMHPYHYFMFEDPDGNKVEVAEWDKSNEK